MHREPEVEILPECELPRRIGHPDHHPYRREGKREMFCKQAAIRAAAGAGIQRTRSNPREWGGKWKITTGKRTRDRTPAIALRGYPKVEGSSLWLFNFS
jgi:hypothetical protein